MTIYLKKLGQILVIVAVVAVSATAGWFDVSTTQAGYIAFPDQDSPIFDGSVYSIAVGSNNVMYFAGSFTSVNGQSRAGLVAVGQDGQLLPWNPIKEGNVYSVTTDGPYVYVIGDFSPQDSTKNLRIARFYVSSGVVDTVWGTDNALSFQLEVGPQAVYVVSMSYRENYYSSPYLLTALDKNSGGKLWEVPLDDVVTKIALHDNTIYLVGEFEEIGGQGRTGIATLDASTGAVKPWNVQLLSDFRDTSSVTSVLIKNNTVYISGDFTSVNNQPRNGLATFDLAGNLLPAIGDHNILDSFSSNINNIAISGNSVYLFGDMYFGDDISTETPSLVEINLLTNETLVIGLEGSTYGYFFGSIIVKDNYLFVTDAENYLARYELDADGAIIIEEGQWPPLVSQFVGCPTDVLLPVGVSDGQLLKFNNDSTVYVVSGGGLYPFETYYGFQIYTGQSPQSVIHINEGAGVHSVCDYPAEHYLNIDFHFNQPFVPGTLVNQNGTIFLIMTGKQIPFQNYKSFVGLGYSLKDVINANLTGSGLTQTPGIYSAEVPHTWGSWVSHKGTIYYADETGMVGVPTYDIFLQNHGLPQLIVPANKYDLAILAQNPDLPLLDYYDARVELFSGDSVVDAGERDYERL